MKELKVSEYNELNKSDRGLRQVDNMLNIEISEKQLEADGIKHETEIIRCEITEKTIEFNKLEGDFKKLGDYTKIQVNKNNRKISELNFKFVEDDLRNDDNVIKQNAQNLLNEIDSLKSINNDFDKDLKRKKDKVDKVRIELCNKQEQLISAQENLKSIEEKLEEMNNMNITDNETNYTYEDMLDILNEDINIADEFPNINSELLDNINDVKSTI